jgi:hypothetical protein
MAQQRLAGRGQLAVVTFALLFARLAAAAPVNSDLAIAPNGGGCYPTGISPSVLDMLTLIDPEWAPVLNGQTVDTSPVLVHGTVQGMHGDTSGDFPSTHIRADVNHFVLLDPADAGRLATGNDDGLLHFEWEAGAYPPWAWAGTGDRVVGLGRWIFDCGHPGGSAGTCSVTTSTQCLIDGDCPTGETCTGAHFGYSAELHPPYATAAIRSGRGAVVGHRPGATPVLVTKADIFASPNGGGAGDRCIITNQASSLSLLSVQCFPLAQPVATFNTQDFEFDLPLPPRPPHGRLRWRVLPQPGSGTVPAKLRVQRNLSASPPSLHVIVRLAHRVHGQLPTGYAGTLVAGWVGDPTPLTHVRVTAQAVVINNALQLTPQAQVAPKACSMSNTACNTTADCPSGESCWGADPVKSWVLQAAVNGEWQYFSGLDLVNTGDTIAQTVVYDQYLPASGAVHLEMNGAGHECVDTLYGTSLAVDLASFGFVKGLGCLNSTAHVPGNIDVTYAGPDFGAGMSGSTDYQTPSVGGDGGHCSVTMAQTCVVPADCPASESCVTTGGAFTLHYRIERLP